MRRRPPSPHHHHPGRAAAVAAVVVLVLAVAVVAGCSGNSVTGGHRSAGGPVRVGLLIPQSGPYQVSAAEIRDGFQLYLDTHGGRFGGRRVQVVVADEGDGRQAAATAGKRLIAQAHVDVVVGTTTVDSLLSIQADLARAKIPFIGTGGRASTLGDISHIWHTSWLSREPGAAIADHVRGAVAGPVYVIGPDYQGGHDQVGGFVDAYLAAGGRLANDGGRPTWTPWPTTTNFLPYLNRIAASGAGAVYTFYAGQPAVAFVQQYTQAGLAGRIPLYASGFLVDDAILPAEGPAADGIHSVLNYAADLDTAANRSFVTAFGSAHAGAMPHLLHVTAWDAAAVLDRAVAAAGPDATPEAINTAIGRVGQVDSPRGGWSWSADHTPIQRWYLRRVATDGRGRGNVLVRELATLGTAPTPTPPSPASAPSAR